MDDKTRPTWPRLELPRSSGEDSESGIETSASPACPSFWIGTVTVTLEALAAKVTVFWNAATSWPPMLDTTTVTAEERSPVRVKPTWAEPAVTFAVNCVAANWRTGGMITCVKAWAPAGVGWTRPTLSVATL